MANILSIIEEHYDSDNVTVVLELTQEQGVIYSIAVVPTPLVPVRFTENGGTQVTVSYNTFYTISVVNQCQQVTTTSRMINIYYGEQFIIRSE